MKKQFISSFVCLLFIVWLVSIFASCTMPGSHEPGDSTTTLTVYNNISNDFSLSLGQWSDDKDSRTAEWNSGNVTTMSETSFEYSITIDINGANEFVWTLTDSTITESGTMQEYPDNPGPVPTRVNISNENSSTIRVHAGIWANDHNSRATLFTSPYMLSGSKSNNWEIAPGTYNVWIQKNSLLYPLLDGADAEEFFFESDTDYRIVIGNDTWVCTNLEDSSETSGSLSSTGFALKHPIVYEYSMHPDNGSVDVRIPRKLRWSSSSNTDSCDLYFDTTDGSTLVAQDLIDDEFQVPLAYSTTYYWKVVAKNTSGEYTTNVISFTTEPPLIPELSSIDSGETNQPEIRIDIEFNVNIDEDTLTADDFAVTGGALIERLVRINGCYLLLRMPENHAHVTVTLPANRVEDSQNRRDNITSNILEFDYHHFPMGELRKILFQEDARAVWGLDYETSQLVRFDIARKVVLNAWDLPYDNPVSMDRIGNVLYIIYAEDNAVSRFIIDQDSPDNSTLSGTSFTIPLRPGNSYEESFDIAAIPDRSNLIIAYQDSDWPGDDCVCVIYSTGGSTVIEPIMAGGNSSGRFMDYESGRLVVAESGVSNGEINVYEVGDHALTEIVPYTDTDVFKSHIEMNHSGTRIATNCTNSDIVPHDYANMYSIHDLGISGGALVYRGSWNTGAYCRNPLFSHDSQYIYIMSRDNDILMVWNADGTDYSKVRDISFQQ